jgi:hypothetical protein
VGAAACWAEFLGGAGGGLWSLLPLAKWVVLWPMLRGNLSRGGEVLRRNCVRRFCSSGWSRDRRGREEPEGNVDSQARSQCCPVGVCLAWTGLSSCSLGLGSSSWLHQSPAGLNLPKAKRLAYVSPWLRFPPFALFSVWLPFQLLLSMSGWGSTKEGNRALSRASKSLFQYAMTCPSFILVLNSIYF